MRGWFSGLHHGFDRGFERMRAGYVDLLSALLARRFVIPVAAALICAGLVVVLRPLLQRYALARPNARSSHVTPTPQGGGIAVMIATAIAVVLAGSYWLWSS